MDDDARAYLRKNGWRIPRRCLAARHGCVVTNGWCYKAFVRDAGRPTFRATPSAYMNILQPRDRYPLDPQHVAGALEVLQQLLPSYLGPPAK